MTGRRLAIWTVAPTLLAQAAITTCVANESDLAVRAEAERVAVVERISRSTISVLEVKGTDGGSGVIVSESGVALTNYHVVQPCGPRMLCGRSDGRVVEAVLLGADPAGDLAAIQLLGGDPFTPAPIGDTHRASVGDPVIVAGNPLLLADDFTPSISVGVLSGKNRYQYPSNDLLEYADCLQTDAAINPGNSGGPLFDATGRLLGIVGRASFEKRGRVSVGVGYAVSIEQAMKFLPALEGGAVPDHASLGFTVRSVSGRLSGGPRIDRIDPESLASALGLRVGDEIVRVDDREINSANDLQNTIGTLPAGWPAEITYRRDGDSQRVVIRLGRQHEPGRLYDEVRKSLVRSAQPPDESDYAPGEGITNAVTNRRWVSKILQAYQSTERAKRSAARADQEELPIRDVAGPQAASLTVTDTQLRWRSAERDIRLLRGEAYANQPSVGQPRSVIVGLAAWRELHSDPPAPLTYVGAVPLGPQGATCDTLRRSDGDAETDFYFDRSSGELLGWSCRIRRDGREAEFRPPVDSTGSQGRLTVRVWAPGLPEREFRIGATEP